MSRTHPPTPPTPGARLLKPGVSASQPDVWVIGEGSGMRVWKTFRGGSWLARNTVGRWLARREARNLARLAGLPGTPQQVCRPEPWTIEMSFLASHPVAEQKGAHGLGPAYFDRLEAMLAEIHRRGLNHGDLRRKNLLVDAETGAPCLVDFAQSMHAGPHAMPWSRWIMAEARRVDRISFLKLKRWYLGDVLTRDEQVELAAVPLHLRVGRFLKKRLYRPYKHWRHGIRRRSSREKKLERREQERRRQAPAKGGPA